MRDIELRAYARGYLHGYTFGMENDLGDPIHADELLRSLYRRGYIAGVTDYCLYELKEGEEA